MRSNSKLVLFAMAAIGLAGSMMARADSLTFTITDPTEYTPSNTTISFSATVTAPVTNTNNVFLFGDTNNLPAPLTVNDNYYINNWPLDLTPGQSYSDVLFNVSAPAGTALGTYLGAFTIEAFSSATPAIDETQSFTVVVTPEPPSIFLIVAGLIAAGLAMRRKELFAS